MHRVDKAGGDYWLYRLDGAGPASVEALPEMPAQAGAERADDGTLHRTYNDLLSLLTLSPGHRENLRRRGLSDAEIEARQYRTLPASGRAELAKRLAERYGDLLLKVPGFYVKEDGGRRWWTLAGAAGILIPVRDLAGQIVGLKVRADDPGDGPRYTWLSSARHGGPGPGNRVHCPLFSGQTALVRVTEGELKADIATALSGILTLSVPGVSSWRQVLPILRQCGAKTVRLAFDADARKNRNVARALKLTAQALAREGYAVEMETWDASAGKGIDDLLAAGGRPQVLAGEAALAAVAGTVEAARKADPEPEDAALAAAREKVGQVLEAVRTDPGAPFAPEALEALNLLRDRDPGEWQRMRAGLKKAGVPLRELERAMNQAVRERAQEEAGRPPVRDLPCYTVEGGRICHVRQSQYGPEVVPLCCFDARIVAEEVRDDGAERAMVFAIEGRLPSGEPLPRVLVPADRYAGMNWVTSEWGTRALVLPGQNTKDHLRAAIQILSGNVPRRTIYTHIGWRQVDGQWVYLHGGGAIGADGPVDGIAVELEEALRDYVLPDPPSGDELRQAVKASLFLLDLAPERITAPLLGATYLAPLGEAVTLDLSVFLAGGTGGFKTEATALAQAHWGSGWSGRHLPGNWNATANSLEKAAFLAKDAVLVVDDFAPRGTAADIQRLHHEADRLLRGQGNRAGRGRMRPDGSLRPEYRPRGIIVSSGEDIPSGQSLRARVCILEVTAPAPARGVAGDIDRDRLTRAQEQAAQGLFAQAMAGYVRWLAPQMDTLKAALPERRRKLREEAYKEGLHRRTPDQVAALALGWEMFLRFAVEAGALTEEEKTALWERVWAGLGDMAAAQAEHQAAEDPAARFLALLGAAIASGRAHVADAKDGAEPEDAGRWGWKEKWFGAGENLRSEWQPQGELVGWLEPPNVYLEPEAAYAVAQKLARDQNASLAVSARTLWKRLAEKKLLTATEARKNTVKRIVAGVSKRIISLHMESILSPKMGEMGETGEPPTAPTVSGPKNLPHSAEAANNGGAKMGEQAAGPASDANSPIPAPPFIGAQKKWGRKSDPETIEPQGPAPISPISPILGDISPSTPEDDNSHDEAATALDREEEVF